ncbi:DMP19 family protein [Microvirga mediterraneensis]|uniref:DMP19 family protein n=1 Tax=Microvirga mediterraneensis TaxID=2754695 RepID=A0A838BQ93_9HYPH|nr:DMP19 family protein [Microvirga mediterraneensis]MBA1157185.1 DMP19 family protein [Microvirga mediterraneensis]
MDKNRYLLELSESDQIDFGKVDFQDQSEEQRVFSAVWALESHVNSGGFLQYFSSWDGDTANFAPDALRRIGANACAEIVERALRSVTQEQLPDNYDQRKALISSLIQIDPDKLEHSDADFFTYPDDLTNLLYEYVQKNQSAFSKS